MKTRSFAIPRFSLFFALAIALSSLSIGLSSCSAAYDAVGASNLTELTNTLPNLMSKGIGNFSDHRGDVAKCKEMLTNAITQASTIKNNKQTISALKALNDDVVLPFFTLWEEKGKLSGPAVDAAVENTRKSLESLAKIDKSKKGAPK
ncbi:MAG: hypothetical protein IT270_21610 [Saprospiraceae bacterium]|nr:hypothetical protein [Saprospiraceae bacterium]